MQTMSLPSLLFSTLIPKKDKGKFIIVEQQVEYDNVINDGCFKAGPLKASHDISFVWLFH